MYKLKIRKVGNSAGVTLPREALAELKLGEGDMMILTRTPDGFSVTPYDPKLAEAMEAFTQTRRKFRNALKELAK